MPSWETLNDCPFTASEPLRADGFWFAATEKEKLPFPCPLEEAASPIHEAADVADQVQSRSVVTVTEPDPPEAPNAEGEPDIATWQRGGVGPVLESVVEDPHEEANTAKSARSNREEYRWGTPEAEQSTGQRGPFPVEVVST